MEKAVRKRMRGECPVAELQGPSSILFLTVFTVNFLRFEVHFSCSVWVLRKYSMTVFFHTFGMGYELI